MLAFFGIKACLGKKVVKFGKDNFCLVSRIAWRGDFAEHGKKLVGPLVSHCPVKICHRCLLRAASTAAAFGKKVEVGTWHTVCGAFGAGRHCEVHLVKIGEVG